MNPEVWLPVGLIILSRSIRGSYLVPSHKNQEIEISCYYLKVKVEEKRDNDTYVRKIRAWQKESSTRW